MGKDQNIPQAPANAYKELYKILLIEITLITENKNPYGEKVKLIPDFLIHQETHRKELQKEVKPKQMGISRFFCLFVCLFLSFTCMCYIKCNSLLYLKELSSKNMLGGKYQILFYVLL